MTKDMSGIDGIYYDVVLRPFRAWGGVWHAGLPGLRPGLWYDAHSGHPNSPAGASYDSVVHRPSRVEGASYSRLEGF